MEKNVQRFNKNSRKQLIVWIYLNIDSEKQWKTANSLDFLKHWFRKKLFKNI